MTKQKQKNRHAKEKKTKGSNEHTQYRLGSTAADNTTTTVHNTTQYIMNKNNDIHVLQLMLNG